MAGMAVTMAFPCGSNSEIHNMDTDFEHTMTDRIICPHNILSFWIFEGNNIMGFYDDRTKWLPWL